MQKTDLKSLPGMVKWYSPNLLVETGGRHLITEVFGTFADQRITQATLDGFAPEELQAIVKRYDYSDRPEFSEDGAFWFDYVADLGDGFDSTYAVASLIAQDLLQIPNGPELPGSRLLIMGGDQVYPYPTRKAYRERLATPYELALPQRSPDEAPRRHLFVLPGNHDWYDGLSSFEHRFCQSRFNEVAANRIGGWLCPQHRSYFAIHLPHNWWIWAADIQLSQYLDAGQVYYFRSIANAMKASRTEAPKIILCIAEPSWCYNRSGDLQGESNLEVITKIAADAGARVCAVLAGDLHHYARYQAKETGTQFFTAGGGGAYFSPTHVLDETRTLAWGESPLSLDLQTQRIGGRETGKAACWPSQGTSRRMGLKAIKFPFHNYGFAVGIGIVYWMMTWLYSSTSIGWTQGTRPDTMHCWLIDGQAKITAIGDIALATIVAGMSNYALGLWGMALFVVLVVYAEGRSMTRKVLLGGTHWLAHIVAMVCLYIGFTNLNRAAPDWLIRHNLWPFGPLPLPECRGVRALESASETASIGIVSGLVYSAEMIFLGAIVAGMVWGAYLAICCLFRMHCDQAFSSMALPGFKNFLRIKVEADKVTVFPIGLEEVPSRSSWKPAMKDADGVLRGPAYIPRRPLRPELMEDPIEIRVGGIQKLQPAATAETERAPLEGYAGSGRR